MASSHSLLTIIASFLLFSSVFASIGAGYGVTMSEQGDDAGPGGCPLNTQDCTYTDVCCPTGTYCFGGVFQGVCCPTNSDCTAAVLAKPACSNSSWSLFDATNTPAAQVGVSDYLFCCDAGWIGVSEGPTCFQNDADTKSAFPSQLAPTLTQGQAVKTGGATTTATGGAATASTKPNFGSRNTESALLCFAVMGFAFVVGIL